VFIGNVWKVLDGVLRSTVEAPWAHIDFIAHILAADIADVVLFFPTVGSPFPTSLLGKNVWARWNVV
jgi:hypothetical protein